MEKVSVIVPIYNAGEYLRPCLESIVNQTYLNLEIILIMMVQQIHRLLFVKNIVREILGLGL